MKSKVPSASSSVPPIAPFIPLIVGMIAISFAPILVRYSEAPVSVQGMYRMLFTVLIMLPFGAKQAGAIRRISGKDWLLLAAAGFFLALHFLLWMASLSYTSIASSTIILSLEPVLVMAGAYFVFKERSSRIAILGMLLAILGVVTVGSGDSGVSGDALLGDLLSFLGTVAIVVNMLIAKRLMSRIPSYLYSLIAFAITFACFALYNLFTDTPMFDYPSGEWLLFVLLAVVPTVLGHMIFNWLLQYVKATTISMTVLAEPVGASILAIFLFGEHLGGPQLIGGAFVILGLVIYMRSERKSTAARNPKLETESAA